MRMWLVNTKQMCRKHLLGEHVEIHMIIGCLEKGKSLAGFESLIETHNLKTRHDELVEEMQSRGYKHSTAIERNDFPFFGKINRQQSERDLLSRCWNCTRLKYNL